MADKRLFFTVGADVAPGTKAFDQLARKAQQSMGDVDSALDDSKSTGQRLADALNGQMDEVEAAMRGTAEAAVALGRALGPELAGKIDLTEAATKFQQLGLTVDEVKADADVLADTIKRSMNGLDAGPAVGELERLQGKAKEARDDLEAMGKADVTPLEGGARRATEGIDHVAKSADSSKSVLANMVGNATQDLGALGGVAGSAGVAIGQMGEYMADARAEGDKLGDILRNFGKVAGPIAGIALVTEVIGKMVEAGKEVQQLNADRATAFFDALRDGSDAFAAMRKEIEETGKLDFGQPGKGFLGIAPGIESILPLLDKAGIKFNDWQKLIEEFPQKGGGYLDQLQQMNLSGGEAEDVLNALMQATAAKMEADDKAAQKTKFLADETKSEREVMLQAKQAERERVDSLDATAEAASNTARETAELEGKTMRAEQAARDMAAAWDELTGKLDAEQAIANIGSDFDDMRQKGKEAWDATAQGAEDASAKQAAYAQSVRDAKQDVINLGQQIGLSVPQVKSMLLQIDAGQIDDVERSLAILTRNRTMNINIVTHGGAGYGTGQNGIGARARGGTVGGNEKFTLVGEEGPEIVQLPPGSNVYPTGQKPATWAGTGGTTMTTATSSSNVVAMPVRGGDNYFTIQVYGAEERYVQQLVDAIRRNQRSVS